MARIISFANQKGGVGKTTSAINFAAALAESGKRVLLCDFDPQGNATTGVGIRKKSIRSSVYSMISEDKKASEIILPTSFNGLSILPSSIELAGADIILSEEKRREFYLADRLDVVNDFDVIIIDCPPALGLLTINALCASDYLVIPMQCEYFALEGLSQLTMTLNRVKKMYKPSLELGGILFTMYDGRLNLSIQVAREVQKHFPGKAFRTTVPRSVRVSEAPSHGMPVLFYDKNCKASMSYREAAAEMSARFNIT